MLFNSYIFIFVFLPVALLGFYFLANRFRPEVKFAWLVAASLFFYGWWNSAYLVIILASIFINYLLGSMLSSGPKEKVRKIILLLGMAFNLGLLGYYKYTNFFIDSINQLLGVDIQLDSIVLPLAISFFTFQQVAYLVDAYRGEVKDYDFVHYCLFVTFFPQLIAGPIVHHKEMLPQFIKESDSSRYENIAVGMTIFTIGLFKKGSSTL
jgi:D-alanyl-lipoteichoic acid acyltransferase DltB (MBOAT superfamily)